MVLLNVNLDNNISLSYQADKTDNLLESLDCDSVFDIIKQEHVEKNRCCKFEEECDCPGINQGFAIITNSGKKLCPGSEFCSFRNLFI